MAGATFRRRVLRGRNRGTARGRDGGGRRRAPAARDGGLAREAEMTAPTPSGSSASSRANLRSRETRIASGPAGLVARQDGLERWQAASLERGTSALALPARCSSSRRATARASQRARPSTSCQHFMVATELRPLAKPLDPQRLGGGVLAGASTAPATWTSARFYTGAVKQWRNSDSQAINTGGISRRGGAEMMRCHRRGRVAGFLHRCMAGCCRASTR